MNKKISVQTSVERKIFAPTAAWISLGLAIVLAGGTLPVSTANAIEPKWPSGAYKYLVVDQDLPDALKELGKQLRVNVYVSETLAGRRLRREMADGTAEQYMKRLCESYGIVWFFDGSALHFSAETELKTERVDLGPISADGLTRKLKSLGVIEAKFPIRTVDAHSVTVFGPPPYVSFVRQTVADMQKTLGGKVRVIRGGVESITTP